MPQVVSINPRLLTWARETAKLSLAEAAQRLGLKDTRIATAAEKLEDVERGTRPVNRGLIQKAATLYSRPLITFYLAEPPQRGERGEDFRTLTGGEPPRDGAMLDALVRDVRARQQMLREVLLDEEAPPRGFVGSLSMAAGAKSVEQEIRRILGVSIENQRNTKNPAGLFSLLRSGAEAAGIYVLLLGDLGSHHSDISERVFRGFALADDVAPFVVINDNDAITARSFTLLHELAHIWIGASGISGPLTASAEGAIERFCNEVSGLFLLPDEAFDLPGVVQGEDYASVLTRTLQISATWNVSQAAVTYSLLRRKWITTEVAGELFRTFSIRWREERQRQKDERDPDDQGPSYYIVRRSRLGAALLDTVDRALRGDTLTHTKAARILGVAPTAVIPLLRDRRAA